MRAVFDTSPLCYLVLIDEVQIVPALFDQIFIPQAVELELRHAGAPPVLREWMTHPPGWLEVREVGSRSDPRLKLLHAGEREAILLALDLDAWVVIDEFAGRRAAVAMNVKVTGLLGLLGRAAQRQLVDLPGAFERLRKTHFRADKRLFEEILTQYRHG